MTRTQGQDNGKGTVEVCQEIKEKKKDKDKDRSKANNDYHGLYKVEDSKGKVYWVKLKGKDDCDSVKVNKGWAKVSVKGQPEDTKLKSKKNQWTHVKKGKTLDRDVRVRGQEGQEGRHGLGRPPRGRPSWGARMRPRASLHWWRLTPAGGPPPARMAARRPVDVDAHTRHP